MLTSDTASSSSTCAFLYLKKFYNILSKSKWRFSLPRLMVNCQFILGDLLLIFRILFLKLCLYSFPDLRMTFVYTLLSAVMFVLFRDVLFFRKCSVHDNYYFEHDENQCSTIYSISSLTFMWLTNNYSANSKFSY